MSQESKEPAEKSKTAPAETSRTKIPFEYELNSDGQSVGPDGSQWHVVRLRNVGDAIMTDVEVRLNLMNAEGSLEYDDRSFGSLAPNEAKTLSFLVHASETNQPFLTVHWHEKDTNFYWNSEKGEVRSHLEATTIREDLKKLGAKSEHARKAFLQRQKKVKAKIDATAHAKITKVKDEYGKNEKALNRWSQRNEKKVAKVKSKAKAKVESEIAEIKNEDFETWSKKNREDVQKWMDGKADA